MLLLLGKQVESRHSSSCSRRYLPTLRGEHRNKIVGITGASGPRIIPSLESAANPATRTSQTVCPRLGENSSKFRGLACFRATTPLQDGPVRCIRYFVQTPLLACLTCLCRRRHPSSNLSAPTSSPAVVYLPTTSSPHLASITRMTTVSRQGSKPRKDRLA